MQNEQLTHMKNSIRSIRHSIRIHRDQIGDYRCWVDDEVLYHKTLPELAGTKPELPSADEFLRRCHAFYRNRQAPDEPRQEIPLDSSLRPLELFYEASLDSDLDQGDEKTFQKDLDRLLRALRAHRDKGYETRRFSDDRALYELLPEKKAAVTQLPPRESFLGKNCPAYCEHCQSHPQDFAEATWDKD